MNLQGQLAVVTGAGGGLGRLVADRFQNLEAEVLRLDVAGEGGFVRLDLSRRKCGEAFLERLQSFTSGRPVNYFIGNAGISQKRSIEQLDPDDVHEIMDVNLVANILLYKTLLGTREIDGKTVNVMAEHGVMVFVGSAAADGNQDQGVYSSSKSGLRGFVAGHRYKAAYTERDIDARLVEFPFVETAMAQRAIKMLKRGVGEDGLGELREMKLIMSPEEAVDKIMDAALSQHYAPPIQQFPHDGAVAKIRGYVMGVQERKKSKQ
ncbi:SDR family oxidoreductase [Candidatus Woesearchaeota archaeon]|nr:SDR family oxidoreductase [Candidatus Woesearchaeota archaeon]MBW3021467.1 SDR family oxidoreductase [Candidatus Woesearchaeota archaeon]